MKKFANVINIPFELAPGGSLPLPAGNWDFLYVSELDSGASVVAEGSSFRVPLVVGRRIEFTAPEVQSVMLTNTGASAVSGVLFVGSGDVRDSAVVGTVGVTGVVTISGVVSAINADKSRTEAMEAFTGMRTKFGAAANYSSVIFGNPLGSAKNVFIRKLVITTTAAAAVVGVNKVPDVAATLADPNIASLSSAIASSNKKIGGPDGVVYGHAIGSTVVGTSLVGVASILGFYVGPDDPLEYSMEEPFMLEPGCGLAMCVDTANQSLKAAIEMFQEDI